MFLTVHLNRSSDMVAPSWEEAESSECVQRGSGFKQLLEGSTDLLDHVRGGGGTAVLEKGLIVTLPGQRSSTESSHQCRINTRRNKRA